MNIPYLKLPVLLLLLMTAGTVAAEPSRSGGSFWGRLGGNEVTRRDETLRRRHERQQARRAERDEMLEGERCAERRSGEIACVRPDGMQKRNRLTPDERRALRRQIQDAGHELYVPAK
ncbi:MAG: hypothetical protein HYZ65_13995 [Burkholderiales bacterium]|nr:hypothetical protein [Burkholderiales bacterium]